jgi:hypothetical protein
MLEGEQVVVTPVRFDEVVRATVPLKPPVLAIPTYDVPVWLGANERLFGLAQTQNSPASEYTEDGPLRTSEPPNARRADATRTTRNRSIVAAEGASARRVGDPIWSSPRFVGC